MLYKEGSLLSRFYGGKSPGLVQDFEEAETKISRLVNGDTGFVSEVLAAQEPVRLRYDRNVVKPAFDAAFRRLLGPPAPGARKFEYDNSYVSVVRSDAEGGESSPANPDRGREKVYILLHVDGLFQHIRGEVYAFEGIPRVVDVIVEALARFHRPGNHRFHD